MQFRSKLEGSIWKKAKIRKGRRKFPKMEFESEKLPYVLVRKYIPDIILRHRNGTTTFIEVKGYLRPADRTKLIAVKRFNPEIDLRIVFAQDNFLYKGSKTRYSDWARKNGFPFAFGEIPKEWMK